MNKQKLKKIKDETLECKRFLYDRGLLGSNASIYTKTKNLIIKKFISYIINNDVLGFQEFCKDFQEFKNRK